MSVPIVDQWCPTSKYGIKCPYTRTPDRIVVHNTANDAPATNEVTYMLNNNNEISYHVAVDDREVRRAIPFNRNCWASGDGNGVGNMKGIHIEICYSLGGGTKFMMAEQNAAWYIATLLKEYGWGIDKVTKHQDYDQKYCPHRTLDLGWKRFLLMVEHELDILNKEDDVVTYEQWCEFQKRYEKEKQAKAVSSWAKDSWDRAVANGILDGTQPQGNLTREQAAKVLDNVGLLPK